MKRKTKKTARTFLLLAGCIMFANVPAAAQQVEPMADIHLHYYGEQIGVTSPEDVIAALDRNHIALAVIIGTPTELALKISRLGGDWVIPLFSPYLTGRHRRDWYTDQDVLVQAEKALSSGIYRGIGEVHLRHALGPSRKNTIFTGLIRLSIRFDVPIMIHTEASSEKYFEPVCLKYPRARFLWAHAGGLLNAKQVGQLMAKCPNVWVEFSARDPRRYILTPIADDKGALLPGWIKLINKYPNRFMTGSDPVWPVDNLHRWDEPDTGWLEIDRFIAFHRLWISQLPPALAKKVRIENARAFFRNPGRRVKPLP